MSKKILFATLLFLVSCVPLPSAVEPTIAQTQVVRPTITPEANSDICQWFIETQFLRAKRLGGLSEFNEWYQEYGTEGFVSPDDSVIEELVGVLKRYQPYQEQFVEDWIKLGSHPEAKEFWEKELLSVQLRTRAFDEMIKGFEGQDLDEYNHGLTTFGESSRVGREAESAMLEIRSKCIE